MPGPEGDREHHRAHHRAEGRRCRRADVAQAATRAGAVLGELLPDRERPAHQPRAEGEAASTSAGAGCPAPTPNARSRRRRGGAPARRAAPPRCVTAPRTTPRRRARSRATGDRAARRPARHPRRARATIGSTTTYGFHGSRNHSSPARSSNHTIPAAAPQAAVRRPMRSTSTSDSTMHAASSTNRVRIIESPAFLPSSRYAGTLA